MRSLNLFGSQGPQGVPNFQKAQWQSSDWSAHLLGIRSLETFRSELQSLQQIDSNAVKKDAFKMLLDNSNELEGKHALVLFQHIYGHQDVDSSQSLQPQLVTALVQHIDTHLKSRDSLPLHMPLKRREAEQLALSGLKTLQQTLNTAIQNRGNQSSAVSAPQKERLFEDQKRQKRIVQNLVQHFNNSTTAAVRDQLRICISQMLTYTDRPVELLQEIPAELHTGVLREYLSPHRDLPTNEVKMAMISLYAQSLHDSQNWDRALFEIQTWPQEERAIVLQQMRNDIAMNIVDHPERAMDMMHLQMNLLQRAQDQMFRPPDYRNEATRRAFVEDLAHSFALSLPEISNRPEFGLIKTFVYHMPLSLQRNVLAAVAVNAPTLLQKSELQHTLNQAQEFVRNHIRANQGGNQEELNEALSVIAEHIEQVDVRVIVQMMNDLPDAAIKIFIKAACLYETQSILFTGLADIHEPSLFQAVGLIIAACDAESRCGFLRELCKKGAPDELIQQVRQHISYAEHAAYCMQRTAYAYYDGSLQAGQELKTVAWNENFIEAALTDQPSIYKRIRQDVNQIVSDIPRGNNYRIGDAEWSVQKTKELWDDPTKRDELVEYVRFVASVPAFQHVEWTAELLSKITPESSSLQDSDNETDTERSSTTSEESMLTPQDIARIAACAVIYHIQQLVDAHPCEDKEKMLCGILSLAHQGAIGAGRVNLRRQLGGDFDDSTMRLQGIEIDADLRVHARCETSICSNYMFAMCTGNGDNIEADILAPEQVRIVRNINLDRGYPTNLGTYQVECTLDIPHESGEMCTTCIQANPLYGHLEPDFYARVEVVAGQKLYDQYGKEYCSDQARPDSQKESRAMEERIFAGFSSDYQKIQTQKDPALKYQALRELYQRTAFAGNDCREASIMVPSFVQNAVCMDQEEYNTRSDAAIACFPEYCRMCKLHRQHNLRINYDRARVDLASCSNEEVVKKISKQNTALAAESP